MTFICFLPMNNITFIIHDIALTATKILKCFVAVSTIGLTGSRYVSIVNSF